MSACCGFERTADGQFTPEKAAKELRHYRRKGPGWTTRLLLDGIRRASLHGESSLDVGAGIGALTWELAKNGTQRAIIVEASAAYLAAASEEAALRHSHLPIQLVHGDFLAVADTLPTVGVVTLDRVVCCYPSFEPLLRRALRHAERGIAYSYPRDRWYVRAVTWLENLRRSRRTSFRTFVHPVAEMTQLIEASGFKLVHQRVTWGWSADVFVRDCKPLPRS